MTSPRGDLLAGRYRVLKRLGSGGMATVLLADDERLGRQVAVKRMHAESPNEVAKRFRREARLGASLNHPNVVSIFDIETDGYNVLIVMEYVPGGTLKEALAGGPLSVDASLDLLEGVAAGLDYAHDNGVVHRDVKPANILLDAEGRPKLADLGIATAAEVTRITLPGSVLGTAAYMSPERLDGHPGGTAVDVYALAAVAYEVLSGRPAHRGATPLEIANSVMSGPPPDLHTYMPGAPADAAAVLSDGMALKPSDRPGTAGELISALAVAFGRAEPEPAARPARAPAPVAGRERNWLVPAVALVVAALAGAAVLALAGGDDSGSDGQRATQSPSGETGTAGTAPPKDPAEVELTPTQVVEVFYARAADDDFEDAWELAGPGLREQLGGYDSFVNTLQTLESIEFPQLETTLESEDSATVQLQSVATHTDRTDRCSGSAALAGGGGEWKIESLNVDCNQGAPSGTNPPQATPGKGPAGGRPVEPKKPKKPKEEK